MDARTHHDQNWIVATGEMADRIRNFPWATTPLGEIERWPDRLLGAVEAMLVTPQVATLAIGPERIFLYNDEASRHYGERHPNVLGMPINMAFEHEFEMVANLYDRVWAGESVYIPTQVLNPAKDGAAEIFEAYLSPIRNTDGQIIAAQMAGRAITERQNTERKLRESEQRLALAFATLPIGIAIIDPTGDLVMANAEMRRFLPTGRIPSRDPVRSDRWQGWDAEGQVIEPENFPGARALRGDAVSPGLQMLYRDDDGVEVWTEVLSSPLIDHTTKIVGAITVVVDVDRIKRSEEAANASEELLRQFGEASHDLLWIRDATTMQWVYLTPAFETIYGLSRAAASISDNYRSWLEMVIPEDRDHAAGCLGRVRMGEHVHFEFRIRRPADQTVRWLRSTDFPIFDRTGNVVLIGGICHDFTDVQAAELRLQTLVEGMPQMVWRAGNEGRWTWASPQWTEYTGQRQDESTDLGWLSVLHPDDRDTVRNAWTRAPADGGFEVEHRVRHDQDGEYRWYKTRATPVTDPTGIIIEWLGTSTDIHELRELQERQHILVSELQHRTRNLMGVVQSLADKTVRTSGNLSDFRDRFRHRMEALSRVQGLLSRLHDHDRVTFDELITTELAAMGDSSDRVTLAGPSGIRLRSSAVQTLAMVLHELATNAVKYGALGQPTGLLDVTWSLDPIAADGEPWLHIDWHERAVIMPLAGTAPTGTGQGRELIERALPYQLKAKVSYLLGEDGVRCRISLPVSASTVGRKANV